MFYSWCCIEGFDKEMYTIMLGNKMCKDNIIKKLTELIKK